MTDWYGTSAAWWVPLERDARRRLGPTLRHRLGAAKPWHIKDVQTLTYFVGGLDVVGDREPVDVEIRFYATPPYDTFGQCPRDYPRVFAKPGATSLHRHPDQSLCLWTPWDPPARRWTCDKGLLELVELTSQHLFLENYWRVHRVWLMEDSPHGFPRHRSLKGDDHQWASPRPRTRAGRRRRPRSSSPR